MLDRLRSRAMREDEGFTLIELLIVIVILGILAAIVVFAVGSSKSDATASACSADKHTVEVAIEAYKAKNGGYPADYSVLIPPASPSYLKEKPSGDDANIVWNATTGVVSGC